MNHSIMKLASLSLAPLVALSLASCKQEQSVVASDVVTTIDAPGEAAVVETIRVFATVTAVNLPARKVTVKMSDGSSRTFKCGPDVVNFNQIQVNDMVTLTITEEFAVFLGGNAVPSAAVGAGVALAPVGYKPGGIVAETAQVTARITSISTSSHVVVLLFPDGSTHAIKVGPSVNLHNFVVGQDVTAQYTQSVAINVSKF